MKNSLLGIRKMFCPKCGNKECSEMDAWGLSLVLLALIFIELWIPVIGWAMLILTPFAVIFLWLCIPFKRIYNYQCTACKFKKTTWKSL